jgi:hypothetical protein
MELTRKIDLSLYWHVRNLLPAMVHVKSSYEEKELKLPGVSIDVPRFYARSLELGNKEGLRRQLVTVDVFAETKQQRDDIADILYDSFVYNIPVYDFELGSPPPLPPLLGYLRVLDRSSEPIIVFRDLVEKFYWRRKISLSFDYH